MSLDISHAVRGREMPIVTMDPMKLFTAIGSAICTLLLFAIIWVVTPNSGGHWPANWIVLWILLFFAPLALLLWAVTAAPSWEAHAYKWTRRSIQVHAVIASLTTLAGCAAALRPEFLLYGLFAFGAVLIDLVILFWSPWTGFDPEDVRIYRTAQLRLVGIPVAALVIWSFANSGVMVWQAQYIADGKPYCLQVAARAYGYKPVTSLLDLNGLTMHATSDKHGERVAVDAVLVVDIGGGFERRYWSYLLQQFRRMQESPSAQSRIGACQPSIDFGLQLPVW
jgi:hypothetical protein